jgi:hypothetical protein
MGAMATREFSGLLESGGGEAFEEIQQTVYLG